MAGRLSILELRSVRGTGGGPEKTILHGAERQDRTRFAVTVCYLRDARDEVFGIDRRADRLDIDYVEVRERHSFDVRIWPALMALVKGRRIDIVHGHDYKTDLLAWCLAKRTGVAALATAHGWSGRTARERLVYYPAHKRLLARFPRVVAVSADVKRELVRHGASPDRVTVILNGIDADRFQRVPGRAAVVRRALQYQADDIVIGTVGRLEPIKRFDVLLDAFAALTAKDRRLRLVIVGDGSLKADLAAQAARLGLDSNCRFLGHRDDAADLHHAFDVFVQSSDSEGSPNAVLEAMAMETPVVATNAGGTAELVVPDLHGLVVPPGDAPRLAAAILAALSDPEAARARTRAARLRVETELSFDARTRRLEAVYDHVGKSRVPTVSEAMPSSVPHA